MKLNIVKSKNCTILYAARSCNLRKREAISL